MEPNLKKTNHLIRLGSVSKETRGWFTGTHYEAFFVGRWGDPGELPRHASPVRHQSFLDI